MAKILYRIGRWSARNKIKVLIAWLVLMIGVLTVALVMEPKFSDGIRIPGVPAEEAGKVINKEFDMNEDSGSVRIVFHQKGGNLTSEESQKVINEALNKVQEDTNIVNVANPYQNKTISPTMDTVFADVTYSLDKDAVTKASLDQLEDSIEIARNAGIQAELTGNLGILNFPDIGGITEGIGIVLAFIIIGITFGSLLIAGIPILTALVGLAVSMGTIMLGSHLVEMQGVSLTLALMVGLAVGIDYALLIIARHREQLGNGMDLEASIARSIGTAGSAVVFAGVTVIVALAGLAIVGIPFLTVMGVTAGIGVLFAVLLSITLMPAILKMIGNRIDPLRRKKTEKATVPNKSHVDQSSKENFWAKVVTKHPFVVSIVCLAIAVVMSIPALDLKLGLPDNGTKPTENTQRQAYDMLTEGFGEGFNGQITVVLDASQVSGDKMAALQKVASEVAMNEEVAFATPAIPNQKAEFGIVQITPKHGPNADETNDLVHEIRDKGKEIAKDQGVKVYVTGIAVMNIDISEKLLNALPAFIIFIVVFAVILLTVVFRSLFVPIKAVLGFLLTIAATLGMVVYIFQDGHLMDLFGIASKGPILAFLPIFLIGILFGLAMDYEVFLVSRIREDYSQLGDAKKSIRDGMKHSGKVIVAAGLIMISVFAGFALTDDAMIKSMGLALAFGVAFDAFIVRMTLVPAAMQLMGDKAWYLPKWLDKILPNVDIEGVTLRDFE